MALTPRVELLKRITTRTRAHQESKMESPSALMPSSTRDFFDHRPWPAFALHVGLQVKAFGKFMNSDKFVDGKYCDVASKLMTSMSGVFGTEAERVTEFKRIVKNLGLNFKLINKKETRRDRTRYSSDGTVTIDERCVATDGTVTTDERCVANWEFKNDSSNSCAVRQNNAYFVHMQKDHEDRSPMLLVSVIGCHYLQVFGAAWDGDYACVDPLSDPVSLLYVPQGPKHGVLKVARLLSSMDKTIRELSKYYVNLKSEDKRTGFIRGPYWNDNGNLDYDQTLTIDGPQVFEFSWVFKAKSKTDGAVTVKFVQGHYGEAVHRYLAKHSLAPKLFECELLPGGWYAVVTEELVGELATIHTLNREMKKSLENAVKLMHDNDMVHGDLGAKNILVLSDDTVRILEFDWADKVGIATYPPDLHVSLQPTPELRHPEVECGGKIQKAHDRFTVDRLDTRLP